jgi:hypothetical protein
VDSHGYGTASGVAASLAARTGGGTCDLRTRAAFGEVSQNSQNPLSEKAHAIDAS